MILPFLAEIGGEQLIEICRFFAALAAHDPRDDRFHIDTVMEPDEFHDGYPGQPGSGVRDNATKILTAWLLYRTIDLLQVLDGYDCGRLRDRLHVSAEETTRWDQISRRLAAPFRATDRQRCREHRERRARQRATEIRAVNCRVTLLGCATGRSCPGGIHDWRSGRSCGPAPLVCRG